jgi:hypothetical protein
MHTNCSRILLVYLFSLLVSACSSTPTATMDFDSGFDFSGVRKIAIQSLDRTVSSTADVSDIQAGRLNQSLTDELSRRGYEVVPDNADADMLLTWHLVTQERTQVRTYNAMSARYNACWTCGPTSSDSVRVTQYTRGTLIVDLLDPVRMQSVWRSIFESRMREQRDLEQAAETRRTAVEAIFVEFPPQ